MSAEPLDLWAWMMLGFGLLFIAAFLAATWQESRELAPGRARWTRALFAAGFVLLAASTTFPLAERPADLIGVAGAVLALVGLLARSREMPAEAGSDTA